MTVSVLAGLFLLFLVAIIFYGYGFVVRSTRPAGEDGYENCSLCRKKYRTNELVLREVGDYKLLFFCSSCIASLQRDATSIKAP